MKRMTPLLFVLWAAFGGMRATYAAGPEGHFLIGQKTVQNILSGQYPAPTELRHALSDPECWRAYAGGSIGPDICEQQSHYGNTADLAQRLLNRARDDMREAARARDQAAFQKAQRELAFAYGWYNHCATDLNVHPKVNAVIGDNFGNNNKGQKVGHGAQEAQLTAYLLKTIGSSAGKYDVSIPYEFLSKVVGVDEAKLRQAAGVVNGKAAAELWSASKVKLSLEQLRAKWGPVVLDSLQENAGYLRDINSMHNWDLDCGHITTDEYRSLRELALQANGGTLPPGWGKNYLKWFRQLHGLAREEQLRRLKALILGRAPETSAPSAPKQSARPAILSGDRYVGVMLATDFGNLYFPSLFSRVTTDPAPISWQGRKFTWRHGNDTYEGEVSADGSYLVHLTINNTIVLKDIPMDTREAGTMYVGDVQYAVWDAPQAVKCLIRYDPPEQVNPGVIVPSLKTIHFVPTRLRPAILIRFRLTEYGRPFG